MLELLRIYYEFKGFSNKKCVVYFLFREIVTENKVLK